MDPGQTRRESGDGENDLEKQKGTPIVSDVLTAVAVPVEDADFNVALASVEAEDELAEKRFRANVRRGFLRKTFALFALEILVFMGVVCIFMYTPPLMRAAYPYHADGSLNPAAAYLILGMGGVALLYIVGLHCNYDLIQQHPYNLVAAFGLPVALGLFFGCIAVRINDQTTVWIAFGVCVTGVAMLIAFTLQTKYEFEGLPPFMFIALIYLIAFAVLGGTFGGLRILFIAGFCVLFMFYIVYDIQRILKGTHYRQAKPDDPVLTSIFLFSDFVAIFAIALCAAGSR